MPTRLLPTQNHEISLSAAAEMTKRYRDNLDIILNSSYPGVLPLSETFNKDAFNSFFTNTDCKGLRIYYGMDEQLAVHAIIVGVNEDNEDMLPSESLVGDGGIILEDSQRCPPLCPPPSPLNED